jgi:Tat protein translocase TatB subunit
MFGTLGGPELFLIFVVALIVFGPRKLPDIGKSLGRMMSEFRRASNDFKSTIESEVESEKIKESMRIEPPKVKPVKASPPAAAGAAVAAADGTDHPPEADESADPGAPSDSPSAAGADPATSAPGPQGSAEAPPSAEPVPSTVSRQPPAAEESK